MTLTKHSYTVQIIGISEAYFQTLPEDVQQILIEEGHNLELRNREELEAIDNAQLEELKKVMDVYELSDEEYEAFRDIAATSWDAAKEAMGDVMDQVQEVKGVKVLAVRADGVDMNGLRNLGDQLKEKLGEGVIVIASVLDGKV